MGLAVFNLLFIPAALLAHPDGAALTRALVTWRPLPDFNTAFLTLVLATVGATVTPWMIFFQAERGRRQRPNPADVPARPGCDTAIGAILAAVAADRDAGGGCAAVRREGGCLAVRERRRFRHSPGSP